MVLGLYLPSEIVLECVLPLCLVELPSSSRILEVFPGCQILLPPPLPKAFPGLSLIRISFQMNSADPAAPVLSNAHHGKTALHIL
jgi:hypothetical protein